MEQIQEPKKEKKRKLTKKEKIFVGVYAAEENGTKAALKAYNVKGKNPKAIAASIASEMLTNPDITQAITERQKTLKDALVEAGVTPEKIGEKVSELLHASEPIFKNNMTTGEVEQVGEKVDYNAIDKGLKHATAIYGVVDPEKPTQQNTYNFLFSSEVREDVKEIEERIKAKLIKPHETN